MITRDRVVWTLAIFASIAVLAAPALWNHFPLLQFDTGGYLARWYEGILVPSRAVMYGLILNGGEWWNFWPVVLLQSALTVWVIALVLRVHGLFRPLVLFGVIAALSLLTTLSFLTSILLTDIFCGLGVLALYLILLHPGTLDRRQHAGLIVLIAVAAATHSATFAVFVGLLVCAALFCLIDRARLPLAQLRNGILAIALGAVLVFACNLIVTQRLAWTPGGFALSFGRMLQDRIVQRYLADHCPNAHLRLCAYKDQLPEDADVWFWSNTLFDRLGRFAGLGQEMSDIVIDSITAYPGLQLKTAAVAFARQLVRVHTGEGVIDKIWHTYGIIERYTPWVVPAMRAARQQHGELGFDAINAVQFPFALLAMGILPAILILAWRGALPRPAGEFAAAVTLAILANAAVCGVFSNPHDRYGARMVWLAGFAVLVALLRAGKRSARL